MEYKTRKRDPDVNRRARALRDADNMAEALLWNELKDRKLGGYKFVRQSPIVPYFADFLCRKRRLVVELDGSQHADSEYDRRRDEFMCRHGYSILRFWSADVVKNAASVCATILAALDGRLDETVAVDLRYIAAKAKDKQY